jgi:cyanophycin synthetase
VAVQSRPDLRAHLEPDAGKARPVGEALVGTLIPEGSSGRIPVVGVTGVNGKTTTTRLIAHIVGRTHRSVGMTCTEGIYIDGRRIEDGDCSGPRSAGIILQNPLVQAAVFEVARGGILREGLGFDRCDVAVVTNIGEGDHLGIGDIESPGQLARVKGTLVEAVSPGGSAVLNAADPLVAEMASRCPGSVVFFAIDSKHPVMEEHRGRGGRVAFVRDTHLVLAEGSQEIPLVALKNVPLTHGGKVGFQVQNALAAAAAAWSLGIPCEAIRSGLETFAADLDRVPARFNLLEVNGAVVILDYGHNVSSLSCLIEAIDGLPTCRRLVVYSAAGDRRDQDLVRQGELLGHAFDHVILFEDISCSRGRPDGEIFRLFREGLAVGQRVRTIDDVPGALRSVEVALETVRPGELLMAQIDLVDATIEHMKSRLARGAARQITFREAHALIERVAPPVGPRPARAARV